MALRSVPQLGFDEKSVVDAEPPRGRRRGRLSVLRCEVGVVSNRQFLRELVDTVPDNVSEPGWQRFLSTVDFVGRYLYRLPVTAERDDTAWQALLAEQRDEVAETLEALANERAALQSLITELRPAAEPAPPIQQPFSNEPKPAPLFGPDSKDLQVDAEPAPSPTTVPLTVDILAAKGHAPAAVFTCDSCGREFAKRNAWTMHVRSHANGGGNAQIATQREDEAAAVRQVAARIREREAEAAQNEKTGETFEERRARIARSGHTG